ncbi:MAG TPA: universal stress protein [candidate division Zixibacteria bacterium]|nr:universal stress protein [candidate division Zixibacteria bacterium]
MKILLALDGSPSSLVARDLVRDAGWPDGTEVHLLTAYDAPMDWLPAGFELAAGWPGWEAAEEGTRSEIDQELARHEAQLAERGLRVTRHVVRGRAAQVIVAQAGRLEADLVVTGSRGHGKLETMLLGSVADEVTARSPCPVLVARSASVSRLLVATDGSEDAHGIPDVLAALPFAAGKPVEVLAISVPDPPGFDLIATLYTLGSVRPDLLAREATEYAQASGQRMVEHLGRAGITANAHVRRGDPAREIVAAAQELGADLIVLGSRGLGGVERLLLGSVARGVLTAAHCSVLVVRPPAGG